MVRKTNGYLEQYREEIRKGNIIAGQELIMELDRLLSDMDDPRYVYDTTDADIRMDFIENCIKLTKSPFYNQPMKLMLWQKAYISAMYGFKMADETFVNSYNQTKLCDRFHMVILLISRKNGKSETLSALGLTESMVGEQGADLVCSSNDDNQASIIYDAIDTMRELIDPDDLDSKRTVRFIKVFFNNNKIFKLSDKTRNKEGRNIDFAVIDEVHEMRTNVIIKSIQQSQSLKNNPKCVIITTEGFVNDGALDEILKNAREIIRGEDDGVAAERTLPWLYTQDCEAEIWQDERSWMKSNPTLGVVKKWQYLREQVDLARKSKSDRMFVLSKDFNIKQNAVQAWLNLEDYNYPCRFDPEDLRGCFGLGGVDLSETTDMTSAKILVMRKDDKTKYILSHYWIPEGKLDATDDANAGAKYREWAKDGKLTICEGNDIDLSQVADWFYMLYKIYGIKLYKCGYDQKFAKDFLKRMEEYGFECEMVVQSKQVLSNAMKLCETEFKSRLINYNEHEIDKWCLGNAAMEMDSLGNVQAVKIQGQHYKRIDGAVTFIICYEMYRRYRSDMTNLMK